MKVLKNILGKKLSSLKDKLLAEVDVYWAFLRSV